MAEEPREYWPSGHAALEANLDAPFGSIGTRRKLVQI